MIDRLRYRVNLLCKCNNDLAVGYGETVDKARAVAFDFFRRAHGARAKPRDEIVEEVVTTASGSSHYEEVKS